MNFAERLPSLEHGFGHFEADGHQISVIRGDHRTRGTVLVCHGYFDHVGLYRHVIGHVPELGYAVPGMTCPARTSSGPRR